MTKRAANAPRQPALSLTPDDARELRVLSNDLEREVLRGYEEFLYSRDRRVDEKRWKAMRSQEDFHVYRERSSFKENKGGPMLPPFGRGDSTFEIGPQAALAANSKRSMLMGMGTMPGTLDDVMYGVSCSDSTSLRVRNAYVKELVEENAVVAVIDGPTQEDPFRFLGVVWYYKQYPLSGILSNREMLMLACIHTTQLSNGERVGISLSHSIQHRDAPERPDATIRVDYSLGYVFRQIGDATLDVYMTNFVEPKGSIPDAFVLQDSARSLATVTHLCDIALRRKLFVRMRETQRNRVRTMSYSTDDNAERSCALCEKSFSGLFASSGSTCQICTRRVCSKCSMTKHLVIDTDGRSITAKPFDFCLICTLETKDVPAMAIARDELYQRTIAKPRMPMQSSLSSSSSSGSTRGDFASSG